MRSLTNAHCFLPPFLPIRLLARRVEKKKKKLRAECSFAALHLSPGMYGGCLQYLKYNKALKTKWNQDQHARRRLSALVAADATFSAVDDKTDLRARTCVHGFSTPLAVNVHALQ